MRIENCYEVEGVPMSGNPFEYLACRLEPGAPVRFKRRRAINGLVEGTGVFEHAWLYDGINAAVATPERINLHLDCGDEIYVLDDPAELNLPLMHGDGI